MKHNNLLTIQIEGNNIPNMEGLMSCIHTFLDYEDEMSIKMVSLKKTNPIKNIAISKEKSTKRIDVI